MMRSTVIAAGYLACAILAGCGGSPSTDPADLAPLSAEDLEQMKQQDEVVAQEERALILQTPRPRPARSPYAGGRF